MGIGLPRHHDDRSASMGGENTEEILLCSDKDGESGRPLENA